jgi:WD40 repeat protein
VVQCTVSLSVLIVFWNCLDGTFSDGQDRSTHNAPPVILKVSGLGGADVSPSDVVLATTNCEPLIQSGPATRYSNYLETWDIRTLRLLLREPLNEGGAPTASCEAGEVRYSADGSLLVASTGLGDLVRVFNAETLKALRTIRIPLQVSEIHVGNSSIKVNWHSKITGFEVSPLRHLLALRIYRGDYDKHDLINWTQYLGGFVRVYDLDSGVQVNEWEIPTGYLAGGTGLAWSQDGSVLAAAASDRMRCYSGGGTVYFFDLPTSRQVRKIRVPNLVGDIAFGTGNTVYVANGSCAGYFGNRKPRLPTFDAASGNRLGDIEFVDSGIRYNLAVSMNRRALLGYVGREEMRWEFEDTLEVIDQRFAVWDLATRRVVYVSSDLGGHGPNQSVLFTFRLSASGHWAALRSIIDHNQVWLYPLPTFHDGS